MILYIFTIKTTFVLHNQLERSLDSTFDDRPNIIELEYINLHDNIKTFVEHFSFRWGISIDEEANLRVNWLYGIGSIFLSTENIKKNGGRRGEVRWEIQRTHPGLIPWKTNKQIATEMTLDRLI